MEGRKEQESGGGEGRGGLEGRGRGPEGRGGEGRGGGQSELRARPASRWDCAGWVLRPGPGLACPVLLYPALAGGSGRNSRRRAVRRVPGRWPLRSRWLLPLLSHAGLPDWGLRTLSAERTFLSRSRSRCPLLPAGYSGAPSPERARRGAVRGRAARGRSRRELQGQLPTSCLGLAGQTAGSTGRTRARPKRPPRGCRWPRVEGAEVKGLSLQHGNDRGATMAGAAGASAG